MSNFSLLIAVFTSTLIASMKYLVYELMLFIFLFQ